MSRLSLSGVAPNLTYTPTVQQNHNPKAVNDSVTTRRNTAVSIAVLSNDSDADGDTLNVSAVTQGANGTVTITNGGTRVSYVPRSGFTGTDAFTYTVSDGNGGTATATVTVL